MFPKSFTHKSSPVYPDNKGHYIWYKHSAPLIADTGIIEEEHKLLYQSDSVTGDMPSESIYVKVYLVCFTITIITLLTLPFLSKFAA